MVISARAIVRPQKEWDCESRTALACEVRIGRRPHLRLYGSAHEEGPPYEIRVCLPCARMSRGNNQKIDDALAGLEGCGKELAE